MLLNLLAGLILATNGQTYSGHGETVDYLIVKGSGVTVTDLRVRESGPGTNAVMVYGDNVVLRRLLVERAGGAGVYFAAGTNHFLEDSVIRDPARRRGHDSWAIYSATPGSVTVRRNVVYGSGFSTYAPGGTSVIEDNKFLVPGDYRTDCSGRIQRDGPCQCAEFGVALKSGNSVIRDNVIAGYRQADPVCGGSGAPGSGISIAACAPNQHCPTNNVVVSGNLISDSHSGIYVSPRSTAIRIEGNRICRTDQAISDGFNDSLIVANEFIGNETDLNLYGEYHGTNYGNIRASVCATP